MSHGIPSFLVLVVGICNLVHGQNNDVETQLAYTQQTCGRPEGLSSADREATPDTNTISLYETYTITCKSGSIFAGGDNIALPSNTVVVLTCTPLDDGTATLLPAEADWPACVSVDSYKEDIQNFMTQVNDTPSNYAISAGTPAAVLGCWVQVSETEFGTWDCWSRFSSSASLDLGCMDESSTLVGYNTLSVINPDNKIWGQDIIEDPQLTLSLSCVDSTSDAICHDVDTVPAQSATKLRVMQNTRASGDRDPDLKMNIAQVLDSSDPSTVLYRFRCDDGYSFEYGITESNVYGYCSASGGDDPSANEFHVYSTDNPQNTLSCYSTCPSNPTDVSAFIAADENTAFEQLFIPQMKKDEIFSLSRDGVKCASGQSLYPGGPDSYNIKCEGASVDEGANVGKLSCSGEDCPMCVPLCPTNPTASQIVDAAANGILSLTIAEGVAALTSTQITKSELTCEANKGISATVADDHVYTFECVKRDNGAGGVEYKYSCGDSCPTCHDECSSAPSMAASFVDSVTLSGATQPESLVTVSADAVSCAEGYALSASDQGKEFSLWCGNTGQYSCAEGGADCPRCKGECAAVSDFAMASSHVTSINIPKSAPESTVTVDAGDVSCDSGYGLSTTMRSGTFTLWCGTEGTFSCDAVSGENIHCPTCKAVCPASISFPERKVSQLTLSSTSDPDSLVKFDASLVVCEEEFSVPYINKDKSQYSVWCGSEGEYLCEKAGHVVQCPICAATCPWPSDTSEYTFGYVDGGDNEDIILPGMNHVQASCTDTDAVLLGPRYISCVKGEASFIGYQSGAVPSCETGTQVCAAPITGQGIVINGGQTGNIAVGESFTIKCITGNVLELDTRQGSPSTYYLECVGDDPVNENLDAVSCYEGCDKVSTFSGTISPDPVASGQAPYAVGQTVTFSCPKGMEVDGTTGRSIERTCTSLRAWNVPTCVTPQNNSGHKSVLSWILLLLSCYIIIL